MTLKRCPGAGEQEAHTEDISLFSPDRSRPDGHAPYCKKCAATKQREWKHANPQKVGAMKQAWRDKKKKARPPQTTPALA